MARPFRDAGYGPRGWSVVTATYLACQQLAMQIKGTASAKWRAERGFYDEAVDRRMRGKRPRRT